jgi:hypothetical protein
MFGRVRDWLENRKLARLPVTRAQWENAIAGWPVAARYPGAVVRSHPALSGAQGIRRRR